MRDFFAGRLPIFAYFSLPKMLPILFLPYGLSNSFIHARTRAQTNLVRARVCDTPKEVFSLFLLLKNVNYDA